MSGHPGNLTAVLKHFDPAIAASRGMPGEHNSKNKAYVQAYVKAYGTKLRPNYMSVAGYDGMAAIYAALKRLGLTFKKRRSMPRNRTGRMLRIAVPRGSPIKAAWTQRDWSSSTRPGPRPT